MMKVEYKQVECTKESSGVTVGKTYFGKVKQKGFIEILNDDKVLTTYHESYFK